MYLRRKALSRRTLLKGAGVSLALPLLDAMVPAATALAQTPAAARQRMGFFYLPHGAIMNNTPHGAAMDHWTPSGTGRDFQLSNILEPLEAYKDQLTVFSNLDNKPAGGSVHGLNPATWLCPVRPQEGVAPNMAPTLDQIAARVIGQDTALPSVEIAAEPPVIAGNCGGAFGCSYMTTLSFQSETSPLPMEHNPRKLFAALFGEGDTPEQRAAVTRETASILDMIAGRAATLKADLGAADRTALDDYLETVREIERRVQMAESRDLSALDVPQPPIGALEDFDAQLNLMFDLIALAWRADLTRVATFMMAAEATNRTYAHIGVTDGFHPLSHHGNEIDKMKRLATIQRYHVETFAKFLDTLAATPDGEGALLDNAMLLYGSNMSNSDRHDNYPIPNLLVGRGAGKLRGGGHVVCAEHTPIANVHLTLLDRIGAAREQFGDSSGEISEI